MKLWELQYQIRISENTFDKVRIYEAENQEEADKKAHLWCKDYYGNPDEKNDSQDVEHYEFQCGCIAITIQIVKEIEKEAWKEEQFKFAFVVISNG